MHPRFAPLILLLITAAPALSATPELRGTWLTTTGYSATSSAYPLSTPAITNQTFQTLRNIGLNSAYMDVWRDGYTWFSSPTLAAIPGETRDRHPSLGTRDLLQDTLIQAHKNGMAEIAWFQYGFATQYKTSATNPLTTYMQNQGWLLQNSTGAYTDSSNSYYWMNPLVPQVQQFMEGMILDAVSKYDLDGIEFDDRLAWPVQFGYDAYTKAAYKADTGKDLPANSSDPAFIAWRAQKLTAFVTKLYTDIKSKDPGLIIAVAPTLYNYSYTNFCVDWPTWSKTTVNVNGVSRPLFDEYTPQVYSSTESYFQSAWAQQVSNMDPSRLSQLGAGIAMDTGGATYNWATVNQPQVNTQRSTSGTEGQIWWYVNDVLNSNTANLTSYYDVADNGQAPRPDQPADWRSIDLQATALGSSRYTVNVSTPGFYEIVSHVGSTYTLYTTQDFLAGNITFTVPGSLTGVELLIDRRPYTLIPGVTRPFLATVTSGDWNTSSNWQGSLIPNGIGQEAQFNTAVSATTITLGSAVSLGSILFDSPAPYTIKSIAPAASITVGNASRGGSITVNQGNPSLTVPLNLANDTTLSVAAGAKLTLAAISSPVSALTKTGAGIAQITGDSTMNGPLTISAGVVDISAKVTLASATTPLASLRAYLASGSLTTSLATRVIADVADPLAGTITLEPALPGDIDLDGTINADDFARLDRNFARNLIAPDWSDGDFDYDGAITAADYLIIDQAYARLSGGLDPAFVAARQSEFGQAYVSELMTSVPEPASLTILAAAALFFLRPARYRSPVR